MKKPLTGVIFAPSQNRLDFSQSSVGAAFRLEYLLAVINVDKRTPLYAVKGDGLGFTAFADGVLTLEAFTGGMSSTDRLAFFYEDGTQPLPPGAAQDGTDATGVAPPDGAVGIRGWLSGIYARLGGSLSVIPSGSINTTDVQGNAIAGAAATPLEADPDRRFLMVTNTGANPMAYRFGGAADALTGHILAPGESERFDDKCPTGALSVFSTAGTSFFVTTG